MNADEVKPAISERAARARAFLAGDGFLAAVEPPHLRDAAGAYLTRGGKGLRPALVLFCCGAVGGEERWALAAAAAAEVTHNWTLIHDDIIDRDERRRGGPSVHAAFAARAAADFGFGEEEATHYGLALAVLAGDIGPCWAAHLMGRLFENGVTAAEVGVRLATELATVTVPAILAGEVEDVQLSRRPLEETTLAAVEAMLAKKTGALYEWCARAGAAVGGADATVVEGLGVFGRLAGVAFQHVDDTLPFVADEAATGKPARSDLREGKRTAVVLGALANASAAARRSLVARLGRPELTAEELGGLAAELAELGGVAFARARAREYHERALAQLDVLSAGPGRELLAGWADFVITREY